MNFNMYETEEVREILFYLTTEFVENFTLKLCYIK